VPGQGAGAIGKYHVDGTGYHLLESQGQRAVHRTGLHRLGRKGKCRGAAGAVICHIENGHPVDIHVVQGGLACTAIAVDIACVGLLNQAVADARILQGQAGGILPHDVIGVRLTRFAERHHAYAGDYDLVVHSLLSLELG
jgi:hypothetical protein